MRRRRTKLPRNPGPVVIVVRLINKLKVWKKSEDFFFRLYYIRLNFKMAGRYLPFDLEKIWTQFITVFFLKYLNLKLYCENLKFSKKTHPKRPKPYHPNCNLLTWNVLTETTKVYALYILLVLHNGAERDALVCFLHPLKNALKTKINTSSLLY